MAIFAVIDSNTVHNIADGDAAFAASISSYHQAVVDVTAVVPRPEIGWSYNPLSGTFSPPTIPLVTLINSKIAAYQAAAPALLRTLYTTNTLAGIATDQSDAMFDQFSDVILRLTQGAFPTALYRLMQKTPSGFVTQPMIDNFVATIQSYL